MVIYEVPIEFSVYYKIIYFTSQRLANNDLTVSIKVYVGVATFNFHITYNTYFNRNDENSNFNILQKADLTQY